MSKPTSYCTSCGEARTPENGLEECPVSRMEYRRQGRKEGEVHGLTHLWARVGFVEPWFNYSGPRGHEAC